MLDRRSFLIAAPAVVAVGNLMPVRSIARFYDERIWVSSLRISQLVCFTTIQSASSFDVQDLRTRTNEA